MILSCQNISYSYIVENTLNGVSFHINKGEQTAIVGINGAGKTTLFKILTSELTSDSGKIYINNDTSLGYLAQHADYSSKHTVYEELYTANQTIIILKSKIEEYEEKLLKIPDPSEEFLNEYHQIMETYDSLGGYGYNSLIKGVLKGLGFTDDSFSQNINSLSGGQKTRLALGKLLVKQPDLLLLDEPTNHLDLEAIRWLEGFLSSYKGTLVIISHDRYFLDKIVSKVIDIENGKAVVYKGNYSSFIQKKELYQNIARKHFEQQQAELKRQKEIIRRLRSYNDEKFIKRAVSREKAIDKMDMLDKPIHLRTNMNLTLNPKRESGMDVLRINELTMAFDDKKLFSDMNLDIYKGDKIALIGNNGTGKTTLFKILMSQLNATSGIFRLGTSVELAYYDQEHNTLNENLTLIEEISELLPNMETSKIRNLLASFLFTGDDVFKVVKTLSGGEKGRLSLAKLMLSGGNFLLLDEPTNHLDMVSKEVLENALSHYSGTLFFISHDRYFINRVATKVFELSESGTSLYHGNYDYYIEKKSNEKESNSIPTLQVETQSKKDWKSQKEDDKKKRQLKKQLEKAEKSIEIIENRIIDIDNLLTKEDVFMDYTKSNELILEKTAITDELEALFDSWEVLSHESE